MENEQLIQGAWVMTKEDRYNGDIIEVLDHNTYLVRYWESTHPNELPQTCVLHESEIIYKRGPLTDIEKERIRNNEL